MSSQIGREVAVSWTPSALADMANILILGSQVEENLIMRAISQLSECPHLGEKSVEFRPIYRRFICGRYQIVYRATHGRHHWADEIIIAAVRRLDEDLGPDL